MVGHRFVGSRDVPSGVARPQLRQVLAAGEPRGHVTVQLVVGRGLVRDEVGNNSAGDQPLEQIDGVGQHSDRNGLRCRRLASSARSIASSSASSRASRYRVREPAIDPVGVHLGDEGRGAVHRRGEGLRASHAAQAGGHHETPFEMPVEVPGRGGREGLEGPLHDALAPDVDPGARGHLAVHRQAHPLQAAELVRRRPGGHEHGIGDQDAGSVLVRAEDADGLARLHQQRLVGARGARRVETIASKHSQLRAAFPVPP